MEIETEAGKGRGDERSRENTKVIKETVIETWTQSGLIFLSVYRIGQKVEKVNRESKACPTKDVISP
ncbi:hypothetical protein CFP56_042483 [Quercus suber]|uniref:Uncharacterized protein n=1 Tax=Quercus suber TaxID=58331 RepID=A0AAW0LI25_QUESU